MSEEAGVVRTPGTGRGRVLFALTLSSQLTTGEKHKQGRIYYKVNEIIQTFQIKVTEREVQFQEGEITGGYQQEHRNNLEGVTGD